MEDKKISENLLYAPTFFLCLFLFVFLQLLMAKILTNQFLGSINAFSDTFIFATFTIILGSLIAHFTKKLQLRFQILMCSLLLLSGACFFKIPFLLISPIDLSILNPHIMVFLILLKVIFLPNVTLVAILNFLPSWHNTLESENGTKMFRALSLWGILLPLYFYPFVYEKALTTLQNFRIFYVAFSVLFAFVYIISIQFIMKTQDLVQEDCKNDEIVKKDVIMSVIFGAFTGAILISALNYLNLNAISAPFIWALPLAIFALSIFSVLNGAKISSKKWNTTLLWLSFLIFLAFGIKDMSFAKNPLIYFLYANFVLFVASSYIGRYYFAFREKSKNVKISDFSFLCGIFAGFILVNFILPLIFKSQIEHIFVMFLVYALALSIFIIDLARKGKFEHGEMEHGMLIVSLSLILISTFYSFDFSYRINKKIRNFYSTYELKAHRQTAIKTLFSNNRIVAMQGFNYKKKIFDLTPCGYYGWLNGFATIINEERTMLKRPLKIAAVGLGAGTVASYLVPGDELTFFENDKDLVKAVDDFYYIKESKGHVNIVQENPRISFLKSPNLKFDLILVDLSANKNNPTFLMTKEAHEAYQKHLNANGIIVYNISRKNLLLAPALNKLAKDMKIPSTYTIARFPKRFVGNFTSHFFAFYYGKNDIYKKIETIDFKNDNGVIIKSIKSSDIGTTKRAFTDDNSSILQLVTPAILYK